MGVYVNAAGHLGKLVGGKVGRKIGSKVGGLIGARKIGRDAGERLLGRAGRNIARSAAAATPILGSFKRGGKIKKTGLYRLHKGEYVIRAKSAKNFKKRWRKR